jgi:hypothetical protein
MATAKGDIHNPSEPTHRRSIRIYFAPPHSVPACDDAENIDSHVCSAVNYYRFSG